MSEQRRQLRSRLRAQRARIAEPDRRQAAQDLIGHFFRLPGFCRARHIALYSAAGSEIDVWPLLRASLAANKHVYLPQVRGTTVRFARYRDGDALCSGAFGIFEPTSDSPPVRTLLLDFVIVPLLGFDAAGNRIGQGGGYYDRTFSAHRYRNWRRPTLAGVAYDVQRCERVPVQPWDVGLDMIVTEARLYRS